MIKIVIPALAFVVTSAFAQKINDADVPTVVKDSFKEKFSSAKNVRWSKENESEFEAEFKTSVGKQSANFDMTGMWLLTETVIDQKTLPAPVMQTIKKEFSSYKIEEVERVETASQGTFFEVEMESKEKTIIVQLSGDGKVLKSETEEEDK
jgi:hypothetical protein